MIQIIGVPTANGNATVSATSGRISLTDFFDRYDETRWQIASAAEDANGRIRVTYDYPVHGTWDSYGANAAISFQIISDSGDLTPESVVVDVWGTSYYRHQMFHACCVSEAPRVRFNGAPEVPRFEPDNGAFASIDESYVLLTNTPYSLTYRTTQYVEGTEESHDMLPRIFNTWDQYNAFVAERGTSGTIYASAFGFMNYNVAVQPTGVPEPGTLALLGIGLAGVFVARRRALNQA